MKKTLLFTFLFSLLLFQTFAQSVFISEVADPADVYQARFVELYNFGASSVDLNAGSYYLVKQVNGGTYYSTALTGTIGPNSTYVIGNNDADFLANYGFSADQYSTNISGNGDDAYFLYIGGDQTTGTLVDAFGVPDIDGTGQAWEYTDSRAVRNSDIIAPNTVWTADEWTITSANVADMTPGTHTVTAPGPPVWTSGYPMVGNTRDDKCTIVANMDRPGRVYAIVVASGSTAPSALQVKEGNDYATVTVLAFDSVEVTSADEDFSIILGGLTAETAYDIWVVAQDDESTPNLQTSPSGLNTTTTAPRTLTITDPQNNDVFSLGDSLAVRWTSSNIDSLYLAAYYYDDSSIGYIIEQDGEPIAFMTTPDSIKFWIPHDADPGDYDLILMDAADTTFQATVGPLTLQDNRSISWVNPQNETSYYTGDTVVFRWNASGIDSILIGGIDYSDDSFFWLTATDEEMDTPLAVSIPPDTLEFIIPLQASTDSIRLVIYDAADTTFHDIADPVYIIDTIKPRIQMLIPDNGRTDVPLTFNPVLVFNEEVTAASGNLYLYKGDGTLVKTYDLTAASNDYSVFYFEQTPALDPGTQYYFTLDAGVIVDNQDNAFGGISDHSTWSFTTASAQLYFSEYIEGSSNNKALEIYNPTGETVDLENYALVANYNGAAFDGTTYPLHGSIAPGDVYVIINPDFDFTLLADSAAVVDSVWGSPATWFNGDDARGLVQLVGGSWNEMPAYTLIDVIGIDTEDPGTGWDVAGVSAATANHTLLRKITVKTGDAIEGWTVSAGTDPANSEWKVFDQNFVANLGSPTPDASDATEITSFQMFDTTGVLVSTTVTIDSAAATVDVEILFGYGSVADSLVPVPTLSAGATSMPESGDTVDFTSPVVFTVTAEDEITTRDWTVTVTEAGAASTETDITAFDLAEASAPAVIDHNAYTIDIDVPYGTDLTALTPTIEVSAGATIDPASGAATDFTNPVTYTVTAQDGTTTQQWTVTVTAFEPPVLSIYEIQYTADASGDSPHVGEMVEVSGIVTAVNIYQSAFKGYFLQDTASAWNGIYVYDPDHDATQIGDSVTIVGTVSEYYNLTELGSIVGFTTVSTGNTLPGPITLTTGEASAEPWEGCYVTFTDATCTANDLGYDEVYVDDGSGNVKVDDYLYDYDAASAFTVNNIYDLTGVMNYTYDEFKLNPRSADDISDVTAVVNPDDQAQILVYPNPSDGRFILRLSGLSGEVNISVVNMLGKVMLNRQVTLQGDVLEQLDLTDQADGIYYIRVQNNEHVSLLRVVKQ